MMNIKLIRISHVSGFLAGLAFLCLFIIDQLNNEQTILITKTVDELETAVGNKEAGAINVVIIYCQSDKRKSTKKVVKERSADAILIQIKSILMSTAVPVRYYIMSDNAQLVKDVKATVKTWGTEYMERLKIIHKPINIPDVYDGMVRKPFRGRYRCCDGKYFIPQHLRDVDAVLYMDTDMYALDDVHHLWSKLDSFTPDQVMALAGPLSPNHQRRLKKKNTLLENGFNAGLVLVNLTKMRHLNWTKELLLLEREAKTPNDQNQINEYAAKYPNQIYRLHSRWNARWAFTNCGENTDSSVKKSGNNTTISDVGILHTLGSHSVVYTAVRTLITCIKSLTMKENRQNTKENLYKCFSNNKKMDTSCINLLKSSIKLV